MKRCPSCNTQYTDITLLFCLQDGTPLVDGPQAETPTVVLNETETVVARSGHDRMQIPVSDPNAAAWQQSQVTHVASLQPEKKGSNTAIAVAVTAVVMFIVFGTLGIGAWLFLRNGQGEVAKNTGDLSNVSNQNLGFNTSPIPTPQSSRFGDPSGSGRPDPGTGPGSTSLATNSDIPPSLPPPVDDSVVRSQVSDRIYNWKSMLESRNFNAYMGNYADTVDYYRKRNLGIGAVRADKARAFSLYSSMRQNISNMSVSVGPTGETATAVFDKEWTFTGRDTSSGKVRSQLGFRKINGQWLITAERDLKVYYTR